MKRLFVALLITLLSITSCQKYNLSKGLYFADTKDGIIFLELMGGTDCVMYFQGGNEKEDGYYDISEGEIELYAHAETNLSGGTASWWFGGNLGAGIIKGDKFTIKAQRLYLTGLEYHYLTFYRQ